MLITPVHLVTIYKDDILLFLLGSVNIH
jgi:hypothetical protein